MNAYVPGRARIGDPTPQTDPDLFTDGEIRAEIRHLVSLDRRYGAHPLRAAARVSLFAALAHRADVARRLGDTPTEASGVRTCPKHGAVSPCAPDETPHLCDPAVPHCPKCGRSVQ